MTEHSKTDEELALKLCAEFAAMTRADCYGLGNDLVMQAFAAIRKQARDEAIDAVNAVIKKEGYGFQMTSGSLGGCQFRVHKSTLELTEAIEQPKDSK